MNTPIDHQQARKLVDVKIFVERDPPDAEGWTTCRCTGYRYGYSDGSAEIEHEPMSGARLEEVNQSFPLPPITLDNAFQIQRS